MIYFTVIVKGRIETGCSIDAKQWTSVSQDFNVCTWRTFKNLDRNDSSRLGWFDVIMM